jgi:hypothetical protein
MTALPPGERRTRLSTRNPSSPCHIRVYYKQAISCVTPRRAWIQANRLLSEPAVTDRQGIGFGWLQNAWLLHARLKIHRGD